ncbi:MAG TPA: hypothetical protein VEZ19_15720 [Rubrobacter sp.]|nr:hypothetical protein [Rubrobacter sp.]
MRDFRDLKVWERSHRLTLAVLLARDLSYLNPRDHERLTEGVTEIKRMLTSFIKNLRAFAKQT